MRDTEPAICCAVSYLTSQLVTFQLVSKVSWRTHCPPSHTSRGRYYPFRLLCPGEGELPPPSPSRRWKSILRRRLLTSRHESAPQNYVCRILDHHLFSLFHWNIIFADTLPYRCIYLIWFMVGRSSSIPIIYRKTNGILDKRTTYVWLLIASCT